jgi:phage-related protein
MRQQPSAWTAEFYVTSRGDRVVEDFIDNLSTRDQVKIRNYTRLLCENGVKLREPYAAPLTNHNPLWELKPDPHRLLYFAHAGRRFVMLNVFRKTRMRILARHTDTAKRRMSEFLERENDRQEHSV